MTLMTNDLLHSLVFNKLNLIGIIPLNFENAPKPQITKFFHNLKSYMQLAVGKASFQSISEV